MMPGRRRSFLCIATLAIASLSSASPFSAQADSSGPFDIVIRHGRVMDPERRIDTVASVGISGGSIRAISTDSLVGKRIIDATGLVVAPGFIDILSYEPSDPGVWAKINDGVTTALAMHGGTAEPDRWYRAWLRQRPPIHFGASFFYAEARLRFVADRYQHASPEAIARLTAIADSALRQGALGVSFAPEYAPGITPEEILPIMRLAAQYGVPAFFHARYSDMEEPGTNLDALYEVLGYAHATGAAVHIDHINSTGGTFSMARSLAILDSARAAGTDVTACIYPYTFWGTYLNSARFDAGWQRRFHIDFQDLQLGGSSERLTPESFAKYRKLGKLAVAYAIPDEDNRTALRAPYVMIGSDAVLQHGYNNHPRASGTFSRVFAVYVREQHVLSLMNAIAKMTLLPALRLEKACPSLRKKGRVQVGADADLVLFDPERIQDRATVEHPELPSEGIAYVLVSGQIVKDPAGLKKSVRPGTAIRATH